MNDVMRERRPPIEACFPGETALLADFFARGGEFTVQVDGEQPQYGLNPDLSVSPTVSYFKTDTALYIEFSETMDTSSLNVTVVDAELEMNTAASHAEFLTKYNVEWLLSTRGYVDGLLKITPKTSWLVAGPLSGSGAVTITAKDRAGNPTTPGASIPLNVVVSTTAPKLIDFSIDPPATKDAGGKMWLCADSKITLTFDEAARHDKFWGWELMPDLWNGYQTNFAYTYANSGDDRTQEFVLDRDAGSLFAGFDADEIAFYWSAGDTKVDIYPNPLTFSVWQDSTTEKEIKLFVMDWARNERVVDDTHKDLIATTFKYAVDNGPPFVTGIYPVTDDANGITTEITPAQRLVVKFSEPIGSAAFAGDLTSTPVWNGDFTECVITPAVAWPLGTPKTIQVTSASDKVGNAMTGGPYIREYTVTPMPVAYFTPASNSTIGPNQAIYVKFRNPMNTDPYNGSTNTGGLQVSYESDFSPAISTTPAWNYLTGDYVDYNNNDVVKIPMSWSGSGTVYIRCKELDTVSGKDVKLVVSYTVQSNLISYEATPPSGCVLDTGVVKAGDPGNEKIVITFGDDMLGTLPTLSGSLDGPWSAAEWNTLAPYTKLTIPANDDSWSAGDGKTLTISGLVIDSGSGIDFPDIELGYTVLDGIVYASTAQSSNDYPGTASYPKASIQAAVEIAYATYDHDPVSYDSEVHVAAGTYTCKYRGTGGTGIPVLSMREGVSVYGGYQPYDTTWHWNVRDKDVYKTRLEDTSSAAGIDMNNPNRPVEAIGPMDDSTVLGGFYITGTCDNSNNVNYSAGMFIYNGASLKVQNCVIGGGYASARASNMAIYGMIVSTNANPKILNNNINAILPASVDDDGTMCGIRIITNSSPVIEGNTIHGGIESYDASQSFYYGIRIGTGTDTCAPIIQNNPDITGTINSSNGRQSFGIYIDSNNPASNVTITGNVINGGVLDTYTGGSNPNTVGISINNSKAMIGGGNTVSGGSGSELNSYGIYITGNSSVDIKENAVITGGGSAGPTDDSAGICIASSATSTVTVQDNISITGGNGGYNNSSYNTYGIYVASSSPNIKIYGNDSINGGNSYEGAYGIYSTGSAPKIYGNVINGGSNTADESYGVYDNSSSSSLVYNNVISGGSGASSYGMYADNSSTTLIYNNTISAGFGSGGNIGVEMNNSSRPTIKNNIIFTETTKTRICVVEWNNNTDPIAINNNAFYDFGTSGTFHIYYDDANQFIDSTIAGNVSLDGEIGDGAHTLDYYGNIKENPGFVGGGNYRLTAGSPVNVREGGLDGSGWGFLLNDDFDEILRTLGFSPTPPTNTDADGWSMGAFEYDSS